MREAGTDLYGRRLRGLIIVLWRGGLRISEALALTESDLEVTRGSVLVRRGKGGRRREVGMDEWAWDQLRPWLEARVSFPVGPLFCVINGPTCGRPWSGSQVRIALRRTAVHAGVGGALLRTNCDTPTLSRWPGRASVSTSSSAS
jgi:integrase